VEVVYIPDGDCRDRTWIDPGDVNVVGWSQPKPKLKLHITDRAMYSYGRSPKICQLILIDRQRYRHQFEH
jgi:hypothetical protein